MRKLVLLLLFSASAAHGDGFHEVNDVYFGHFNGDSLMDLYVKPKPNIVFIFGEILTPIVFPEEVDDFVLTQNTDKTFSIESDLAGTDFTQWAKAAAISIVLEDLNIDGAVDILLSGVAQVIAGTNNQIVFAPKAPNTAPIGVRAIDLEFQEFFSEIGSAVLEPEYYAGTETETCVTTSGWVWAVWYYAEPGWIIGQGFTPFYVENPGFYFSFRYFEAGECYTTVDTGQIASVDAYLFSSTFEEALDSGQLIEGSNAAIAFESKIGEVLGVSVRVIDIPIDGVPSDVKWFLKLSRAIRLLGLLAIIAEVIDHFDSQLVYHFTTENGRIQIEEQHEPIVGNPFVFFTNVPYWRMPDAMDKLSLCGDPRVGYFILHKQLIPGLSGFSEVPGKICPDGAVRNGRGQQAKALGPVDSQGHRFIKISPF